MIRRITDIMTASIGRAALAPAEPNH